MIVRLRRLAALLLVLASVACNATGPSDEPPFQAIDLRLGTGTEAVNGKTAIVDYVGWLYDEGKTDNKGDVFDTSLNGDPFAFVVGAGRVIRGWDQGVAGMKVGGVRRLIIPSSLAYGGQRVGSIPANSTLLFEVELLDVR